VRNLRSREERKLLVDEKNKLKKKGEGDRSWEKRKKNVLSS